MNTATKIQELREQAGTVELKIVERGPSRPPLPVKRIYDVEAMLGELAPEAEKPTRVNFEIGKKILERLQEKQSNTDVFSRRLARLH